MESRHQILVAEHRVGREPRVEILRRPEHFGEQKVEQRPEFVQVVLQRRARQQQSILRLERANDIRQLKASDGRKSGYVINKPWTFRS